MIQECTLKIVSQLAFIRNLRIRRRLSLAQQLNQPIIRALLVTLFLMYIARRRWRRASCPHRHAAHRLVKVRRRLCLEVRLDALIQHRAVDRHARYLWRGVAQAALAD